MTLYITERFLPGVTSEQLLDTARCAKSTTAKMTEEGTAVRYLHSTFIPADETCFCLFDGPSGETVREANERAEVPFERSVEAVHVSAGELD